jgi:polar amino acid transport system substrate-binding protein
VLQVIQYQKTGEITIEELPVPQLRPGGVLVRNAFSLISAGTERSSVETAKASMLGKARSRPDLVRQVMQNYKREGLVATFEKVRNRLDNYKDLGYCSAGVVIESSCEDFKAGDRVACGGVGYASHAEVIYVPKNLAVAVPDKVILEDASFTTLASIAMQGVRQADVRVGERVVLIGLGLVGLLTLQILKASGCAVFGVDISPKNFELARKLGCDALALSGPSTNAAIEDFTRGYGADVVIITAAAKSNEPIEFAGQCCRKRGRIVVVGAIGMDLPRSPAYEKEIELRMSCSYGPGRYDAEYEEQGIDYPQAYVRWTENRNMESILDLIGAGALDVRSLVTHTFPVQDALKAYDVITQKVAEPYLGVLIRYPQTDAPLTRYVALKPDAPSIGSNTCSVGVIGAGNHTQSYLLPPLRRLGVDLEIVATSKPVSAKSAGSKFGFRQCATEAASVFSSNANLILIGSRHDSHALYVVEGLRAGKNIFVEKPLALNEEELSAIIDTCNQMAATTAPLLMLGYNRRFSAPVLEMKALFDKVQEPLSLFYRVNAGFLAKTNWYQESKQGGRVIGEIGHFIDTLQFLTGANPTEVYAISPNDAASRYSNDNVQISLTFSNGSTGQISYLANGASSMPKEYLEVFGGGKSAIMDAFKRLTLFDGGKTSSKTFAGDKGHASEMAAIVEAVKAGKAPIPLQSLIATSRASFAIVESLRNRTCVSIHS